MGDASAVTESAGPSYLLRRDGGVLTVTLNRPDRLNALDQAMQQDLAELWRRVREDGAVRCVVLTGAGRAFCAGLDTGGMRAAAATAGAGQPRSLFCPAEVVTVPVVVAINGLCVGAGLRFLADADVALAAESAWFADPHVGLGLLGTPVAIQLAAKASSYAVAALFLAGSERRLPARDAHAGGLLTEVVGDGELLPRALALAGLIARQEPAAVRATTAALRTQVRQALAGQLEAEWAAARAALADATAADPVTTDPVTADPAGADTAGTGARREGDR
jgi:enoyl-CoA hydratase